MGRTESLNLKKDYERACGWYGHFNKSEMALFSECTDRYAQKLLDTADIVREAMFHQTTLPSSLQIYKFCLAHPTNVDVDIAFLDELGVNALRYAKVSDAARATNESHASLPWRSTFWR